MVKISVKTFQEYDHIGSPVSVDIGYLPHANLSKLYAKFQRLFLTFTICMIHDERLAMDFLSRQKIQ